MSRETSARLLEYDSIVFEGMVGMNMLEKI